MKNLKTLYQFELKKILSKKIVWVTVAIMLILNVFSICGHLMGGYYEIFLRSKAAEKKLTGRVINQQLLEETWEAYGKIPAVTTTHYTGTAEYWAYAFHYSAIFNFVRGTTGMNVDNAMNWEADEEDMYSRRQAMLEDGWNGDYLKEGEKEYWRQQELSVDKPFEYAYKDGWQTLLNALYTIGFMTLLTITVCLSNMFPVEQARRTDQLILSSRYGKGTLYTAKMLAGISFAAGSSLLYTITAVALTMAFYGGAGFGAAIQFVYPNYSAPLSVGEAVLIGYGLLLVAAILTGVFTMVLSEILGNGMGTLAAVSGIIILTMFVDIPDRYRVLAQLWNYLPSEFISIWGIFDRRLVPFAGTYLTSMQFVPILYIVIGGVLSVTGFKIYKKYQVGAR